MINNDQRQIIFCTEAKDKTKVDETYIKALLIQFNLDEKYRIRFINFEGKGNYNKNNVLSKIF